MRATLWVDDVRSDLHCVVASNFLDRARGLLMRGDAERPAMLCLTPCRAVHTAWMHASLEILFLDRRGFVLRDARIVRPWSVAALWRAHSVCEASPGTAARLGVRRGSRLTFTGECA
jgi:uncharacterized protein